MKNLKVIIAVFVLAFLQISVSAQEKKIKFNKGVLRICSSKNFQIQGYNGSEVIVKSLHDKNKFGKLYTTKSNNLSFPGNGNSFTLKNTQNGNVSYFFGDEDRKKGLKKLGKNMDNEELGIYFSIEQKNGELIFKDNLHVQGQFVMFGNESYEIKVPNSLKLVWETDGCVSGNSSKNPIFYNSNPSSLKNFEGEVEMTSRLSNVKLVDVTGPVSINTIGGNVIIEFDKKQPRELYSVYSNNGYIDVTIPESSSLTIAATGSSIYSDIDFKVAEESKKNGVHYMQLELKSKSRKMKLDAGLGNIYLRKK